IGDYRMAQTGCNSRVRTFAPYPAAGTCLNRNRVPDQYFARLRLALERLASCVKTRQLQRRLRAATTGATQSKHSMRLRGRMLRVPCGVLGCPLLFLVATSCWEKQMAGVECPNRECSRILDRRPGATGFCGNRFSFYGIGKLSAQSFIPFFVHPVWGKRQ